MQTPSSVLDVAIEIARRAHAGQRDKAQRPYIEHALRVMERIPVTDEVARAAAVLHDVIEDTTVTADDLRGAGMPDAVIDAVVALTHLPDEDDDTYLARVAANPIARAVKLADNADNSDEARLALLPEDTAARLRTKYARARAALGAAIGTSRTND